MGLPVKTVAAGGLAVVEATAGTPVTEAAMGIVVTKVTGKPGLPVTFETIGVTPPTPPLVPVTWNPADSIRMTLTSGNLTATATVSNNGCVRATGGGRSTGKYYFEYAPNTFNQGNDFAGLASPSLGLPIIPNTANTAGIDGLARIWVGTNTMFGGSGIDGSMGSLYFAVDLGAGLFWVKQSGGTWNGNAANNPANGVSGGGVSISTLSLPLVPFVKIVLGGVSATANFGASAFVGTVPSGFTAGWPA